jgi:hypothetical protein
MAIVIILAGRADRVPFEHDGAFLKEFDPERGDNPFAGHVEFTRNIAEAKKFASHTDAFAEWTRVSKRLPKRPDGKPNKPLTAFTVVIEDEKTAK